MLSEGEPSSKHRCELCNGGQVQKSVTFFGMLAMYSLWWCGLGILIFKLTLSDYCENCNQSNFMGRAPARRTFSLVLDDKSQLEMPHVRTMELKKQIDENLIKLS